MLGVLKFCVVVIVYVCGIYCQTGPDYDQVHPDGGLDTLIDRNGRDETLILLSNDLQELFTKQNRRITELESELKELKTTHAVLHDKLQFLQENTKNYYGSVKENDVSKPSNVHDTYTDEGKFRKSSDSKKQLKLDKESVSPNYQTITPPLPEGVNEHKFSRKRRSAVTESNDTPIAFHAVNNQTDIQHHGTGETFIFETVLLNLGGAFYPQHGLFIAPVDGVYVFSATILSAVEPHEEFTADVVRNGALLARVYGHGDNHRHDQGSVTVTVRLQRNDQIWVKHVSPPDGWNYGQQYTSFTGFLLTLMYQ